MPVLGRRSHNAAVAVVDPATHAYPAAHGPLHCAVDAPVALPYRPASHSPLHAGVDMPTLAPYDPAAQSLQSALPPTLYRPTPHTRAVALVEPGGHA